MARGMSGDGPGARVQTEVQASAAPEPLQHRMYPRVPSAAHEDDCPAVQPPFSRSSAGPTWQTGALSPSAAPVGCELKMT